MNSFRGEGEQGLVKGASGFAFKGDEFWSVTVDYSECKNKSGFSDCRQSEGSSRVETRDNKHWSMYEGSEVWIHYAIQPKINILFRNDKRRFTVGQCHPSDAGGHKGLQDLQLLVHQKFLQAVYALHRHSILYSS